MLIGYANEEQMDYELAVLDDIMQECSGKPMTGQRLPTSLGSC